ncbi:MAG: TIGR03936 family radical SAM-associated protein [Acidaminococcaceae bacterium]
MKLRIQITKDASIRFISHLEYIRTIERAIRRAKIPVAYSEGFNPHMKFSLASALGVGITSQAEFVEIELAATIDLAATMVQLTAALPRGIRIKAADVVEKRTAKLMAQAGGADYQVLVPCAECAWQDLIQEFNVAPSVLYQKPIPQGRGKTKEIEVKEFIPQVQAKACPEGLCLNFACKITPTGSMKALEFLGILHQQFALPLVLEKADVLRCDLYALNSKGKKKALLNNDYRA